MDIIKNLCYYTVMSIIFTLATDEKTGVDFIHTAYIGEDGIPTTDTFDTMMDQRTNAALARLEANWLKSMVDFKIDEVNPSVGEELKVATEKGAGIQPLPPKLRAVQKSYVYKRVNDL